LIEVLVVVAIIAVLVSILLPALANAREQARKAACQSNQKQVFTAISFYARDNGGWGVPQIHWQAPGTFSQTEGWAPQYTPGMKIFVCPANAPDLVTSTRELGVYYSTNGGEFGASYHVMFGLASGSQWNCYGGWAADEYPTAPGPQYEVGRHPSPNGERLGRWNKCDMPNPDTGQQAWVWLDPAEKQPAVTDAFNPKTGLWYARFLGVVYKPNNHWSLFGENVCYMDGHVVWLDGGDLLRRYPDGRHTNRFAGWW